MDSAGTGDGLGVIGDLDTLTVIALKKRAREVDVSPVGAKDELIKRLRSPEEYRVYAGAVDGHRVALKVTDVFNVAALKVVANKYLELTHPDKETIDLWRAALRGHVDAEKMGAGSYWPELYALCQFLGSKRGPAPGVWGRAGLCVD